MKDKFAIKLTWHNCLTYPPKESWNDNLYATDGQYIFKVEYNEHLGWYDQEAGRLLSPMSLSKCWWADLEQTVRTSIEFQDKQIGKESSVINEVFLPCIECTNGAWNKSQCEECMHTGKFEYFSSRRSVGE